MGRSGALRLRPVPNVFCCVAGGGKTVAVNTTTRPPVRHRLLTTSTALTLLCPFGYDTFLQQGAAHDHNVVPKRGWPASADGGTEWPAGEAAKVSVPNCVGGSMDGGGAFLQHPRHSPSVQGLTPPSIDARGMFAEVAVARQTSRLPGPPTTIPPQRR